MTQASLRSKLESGRQSPAFQNYLDIHSHVLETLDEMDRQNCRPSHYWEEELAGFDYMLDAFPFIVLKMRKH